MNEITSRTAAYETPNHRPAVAAHLLARWPSVVGLLALTTNAAGGVDSHVTAFIIILASTCYLGAAVLGSQVAGWLMVAIVSVAVVVAGLTGLDATVTVLVLGAALAGFGFLRAGRVDRREVAIQTLAFTGFSVIALTAMMTGPSVAALLAASAAIGHGVWDAVHFVRDKVVSRSLAEACFVLDVGLGVALLATLAVSST